jgi:hypothetical protein
MGLSYPLCPLMLCYFDTCGACDISHWFYLNLCFKGKYSRLLKLNIGYSDANSINKLHERPLMFQVIAILVHKLASFFRVIFFTSILDLFGRKIFKIIVSTKPAIIFYWLCALADPGVEVAPNFSKTSEKHV